MSGIYMILSEVWGAEFEMGSHYVALAVQEFTM